MLQQVDQKHFLLAQLTIFVSGYWIGKTSEKEIFEQEKETAKVILCITEKSTGR